MARGRAALPKPKPNQVTRGVKHIVRSDVLYMRTNPNPIPNPNPNPNPNLTLTLTLALNVYAALTLTLTLTLTPRCCTCYPVLSSRGTSYKVRGRGLLARTFYGLLLLHSKTTGRDHLTVLPEGD